MRACKACLRARDVTAMFSCARAKDEENDKEGTKMGKKKVRKLCLLTRGIFTVNLYTCLICHIMVFSTRRIEELLGVVPRNLPRILILQ